MIASILSGSGMTPLLETMYPPNFTDVPILNLLLLTVMLYFLHLFSTSFMVLMRLSTVSPSHNISSISFWVFLIPAKMLSVLVLSSSPELFKPIGALVYLYLPFTGYGNKNVVRFFASSSSSIWKYAFFKSNVQKYFEFGCKH